MEFEHCEINFDLGSEPEIEVRSPDGVSTARPEASQGGSGYEVQARAFADAIRAGGSSSPVLLEDAIRTGRVLEAELESIESGTRVQVRVE